MGPVEIGDLQRLSGGASRETWSFTANGRPLILRRDPPGRPAAPGAARLEADSMRACHKAAL
jgi:aminoglycoside phosphotransferase (APT) family kinase protein